MSHTSQMNATEWCLLSRARLKKVKGKSNLFISFFSLHLRKPAFTDRVVLMRPIPIFFYYNPLHENLYVELAVKVLIS